MRTTHMLLCTILIFGNATAEPIQPNVRANIPVRIDFPILRDQMERAVEWEFEANGVDMETRELSLLITMATYINEGTLAVRSVTFTMSEEGYVVGARAVTAPRAGTERSPIRMIFTYGNKTSNELRAPESLRDHMTAWKDANTAGRTYEQLVFERRSQPERVTIVAFYCTGHPCPGIYPLSSVRDY